MTVTTQVIASAFIVLAVLWWMWRLPRKGATYDAWAAPLALGSAWAGLLGLVLSLLLWLVPFPDALVVALFLVIDPIAIGTGTLVFWIYRGLLLSEEEIDMQRVQAKVGLVLGIAAVAIGYIYVMTHKTPFTPVGV